MKSVKLGSLGTKFFAYVQAREIEIVCLGDLQARLGLSPAQEQSLLKRLANSGFILRLKRGVYLVPERFPMGGSWQPNEYYLIAKYMQFVDAKYYIGGFVAIHYYGLTTQIPNVFTVYNDTFSGNRMIGKLKITFIKILPNRINGSVDLQ